MHNQFKFFTVITVFKEKKGKPWPHHNSSLAAAFLHLTCKKIQCTPLPVKTASLRLLIILLFISHLSVEDKIINVSKNANCRKTFAFGVFSFPFAWMHLKPKWFSCLYAASIYIIKHLTEEEKVHVKCLEGTHKRHRCTGISASLLLLYREASEHATSCRVSAPHIQKQMCQAVSQTLGLLLPIATEGMLHFILSCSNK